MATIKQILSMSLDDRKKEYKATNIEKVTIDGVEFTDYGAFSFLREKSYVKSPVRSADGSIGNLNSYATFVTPHLKIDFSLMSIDSYRDLMDLIYSKNEFTVTCYDVVSNQTVTNSMYFATEEMPKLLSIARAINGEEWVELLGVQDYTVELIGTNTGLDTINILYYDNSGNLLDSQEAIRGEDVVISFNYYAPSGYRFDGEWIKDGGGIVRNGDVIKANTYSDKINHIKLKAVLVATNEYDLAISYGNGKEIYNSTNGGVVNSIKITKGQSINTAFSNANITISDGTKLTFPENGTVAKSVEYDGELYTPYEFQGWFWTPTKSEATQVNGSTVFDSDFNRTIYQLYTPKKFKVTYYEGSNYVFIEDVYIEYGASVPLPKPRSEGYTFIGWYTDNVTFQNKFSGSMPPKDITLYAKWVKNS